jgi:hypothetical protein
MGFRLILSSSELLYSDSLSSSFLDFSPVSVLLTDILLDNRFLINYDIVLVTTKGGDTSDIDLLLLLKLDHASHEAFLTTSWMEKCWVINCGAVLLKADGKGLSQIVKHP